MTTIRQILAGKPDVYATNPEATVLDALRLLDEKNVGALLVMKGPRSSASSPSATTRGGWSSTGAPRRRRPCARS